MGGYTKNFNDYAEQAQLEVMDSYLGATLRSQTRGVPINQQTNDAFRNLETGVFAQVNSSGVIPIDTLPNYRYLSSILFPTQNNVANEIVNFKTRVRVLDDSESWFYEEDSMYSPSYKYPIAKIINNNIYVYPKNTQVVYLTYYKTPVKPIWASRLTAIYAEMESPISNGAFSVGQGSTGLPHGIILRVSSVSSGYIDKLDVINVGSNIPTATLTTNLNIATPSSTPAGTVTITSRPSYDAVNSVQLQVGDSLHMDILKIMLGYCSIKIRDMELFEAAQAEQQRA